MKILHWVKKENSGLLRTVVELAKYEERAGHTIQLRSPDKNIMLYGKPEEDFDIHCIHSQINPKYYKDGKPKMLFLHGEPDYGMLIKISTQAIMDLAPIVDTFIAFNKDEANIWNSFKRTRVITKGIDLESYKPVNNGKRLTGNPAVVYAEHWRGFRHPMHSFVAMDDVVRKLPKAKFYAFGCPEKEKPFWNRLIKHNHYTVFTPGIFGRVKNQTALLSMADIVVSPVFPSYGRVSLEAKACNKPVVAYNTNPHADFRCEPYNPQSMADAILKCWETKPNGQRKYVEENCNIKTTADEAIKIYKEYVH